jgi:hypothetical protein
MKFRTGRHRAAIATAALAVFSAASGPDRAVAVSDQLFATVGSATFYSGSSNVAAPGQLEAPLAFARINAGSASAPSWQAFDVGSLLATGIGLTGSAVDDVKLGNWLSSLQTSGAELFLTEPGNPGAVSDVLIRYTASVTVNLPLLGSVSRSGDAIVLFSDPLLVDRLVAWGHLASFSSVAETGALQEVKGYLYPAGGPVSPFSSIQVLSAVPETGSLGLVLAGLGLVAGATRRRRG